MLYLTDLLRDHAIGFFTIDTDQRKLVDVEEF